MSEPVKCFSKQKEAVEYRDQQEVKNPGRFYNVETKHSRFSSQACVSEIERCQEGAEYKEKGTLFNNPNLHNAWKCSDALNRIKSGQTGETTQACRPQVIGPTWSWNKHYRVVCDEPKK